jgi:hypothetical protein
MNKDADTRGSRLWSGGRERDQWPQVEPQADEKVVPLGRPAMASDRTYTAFEVRERAERMHIHCATQPSRFPSYNYLLDIIYDHDFDSIFTLIYSFMTVEVTGKHLAPIVHAINFGTCERIREYHSKLYDPPAKDAPIIQAIKITAAGQE